MDDGQNTTQRVLNISYPAFRLAHLLPNKPLLIGPDLIASWPCVQTWRADPVNGELHVSNYTQPTRETEKNGQAKGCSAPNLGYIREAYGNFTVPVDDDGCRSERLLREVIDIWEGKNDSAADKAEERLYVKDWHLALQSEAASSQGDSKEEIGRDDGSFYTTPTIFADDWMNAYYRRNTKDDFRFVYMGPAGTYTRLHRDVYTSYSWSTNVVGRKRWWLFPPTVTPHITKPNGETVGDSFSITGSFDSDGVDTIIWPNWEVAKRAMYVVNQEEGETIFVPSGWYHQVLNLTFCISINHNWSNSHNLVSMYRSMVDAVERVELAIADVKELLRKRLPVGEWEVEWRKVVQDLLKQDAGWDWSTFLGMVVLGVEDCMLDMSEGPSRSSYADLSFPAITPGQQYVIEQVTPCVAHFTTSSWGQSGEYDALLSRISYLMSQINVGRVT